MTRIAVVLNIILQEENVFGQPLTACPLFLSGEAGNHSYRLVTSQPNLLRLIDFLRSIQVVRFLQLSLQNARSSHVYLVEAPAKCHVSVTKAQE